MGTEWPGNASHLRGGGRLAEATVAKRSRQFELRYERRGRETRKPWES